MEETLQGMEQKVSEQIDTTLQSSPAAPAKQVDPSVARNIAATGIQAHEAAPQQPQTIDMGNGITGTYTPASLGSRISYSGDGYKRPEDVYAPQAGRKYGAVRKDAMSPATQLQKGVTISDAGAYHIGGQALPGQTIRAMAPGEKDSFYLKSKFNPVKPYPLTMANGDKFETDTSNIKKAMYLYAMAAQPRSDVDFFGYNRLPKEPEEGRMHSFFRHLVNAPVRTLTGTVGAVGAGAIDAAEGVGALIDSDEMVEFANKMRPVWFDTVRSQTELATWDFGPRSMGEKQNIGENTGFWSVFGDALGSIPMAYVAGPASYATVALMEGAGSSYAIREALFNKGMSTKDAAALAAVGGAGTFALGMAPEAAERIFKSLTVPAGKIAKALKENPEKVWAMVAAKKVRNAFFGEGLSEWTQSEWEAAFTGEKLTWEGRLSIFFASAIVGAASSTLSVSNEIERVKVATDKLHKFFEAHHAELKKIVDESNGALTEENIKDILEAMAFDNTGAEAINYLKEAALANFDKLTPEEKAGLREMLKKFDSVEALDKEFRVLDERISKLTDGLPANDAMLIRSMLRGVAMMRLRYQGVLPSQMELPADIIAAHKRADGVTGDGKALPAGASGMYDPASNTIVYPASETYATTPEGGRRPSTATSYRGNVAVSQKVGNELLPGMTDGGISRSTGGLMHEFVHWLEATTGLTKIPEYVQKVQDLVSSVVPGYLEGKEGVEFSEAFAYATEFANSAAKDVLGLGSDAANYMEFAHMVFQAQEIAEGTYGKLKDFMKSYEKLLKTNASLIKSLVDEFGEPQLSGAIDSFLEGNPSALTGDAIRALGAVISSAADAETTKTLTDLFNGNPAKMQTFADKASNMFNRAISYSEAKVKLAQRVKENVAKANEVSGSGADPKDASAPATSEQKLIDVTSKDEEQAPAQPEKKTTTTPNVEQPSEEPKAKKTPGTYDVDKSIEGRLTPEEFIGYRQQVAEWLKPLGIHRADLPKYKVNVFDKPEAKTGSKYTITTTPASDSSEVDHKIAYAVILENRLKQAIKNKVFSEDQTKRLDEAGLYSVDDLSDVNGNGLAMRVKETTKTAIDKLADLVANGKASPEAVSVYAELVNFDREINNIYPGIGEYVPVDSARAALAVTNHVIDSLSGFAGMKRFGEEGTESNIVKLLTGKYFGPEDFPEQVAEAVMDLYPEKGNLRSRGVSLIDALTRYRESLEERIDDADAIFAQEKNPIYKDLNKTVAEARRAEFLATKGRKGRASASEVKSIPANAKITTLPRGTAFGAKKAETSSYFVPSYDADYSERFVSQENIQALEESLRSGKLSPQERAAADQILNEERVLSKTRNPARSWLNRDPFHTPTPLEEMGISVKDATDIITKAGLTPIEFDVEEMGLVEKGLRYLNADDLRRSDSTRRILFARLVSAIPSLPANASEAEQMQVLLAIQNAKQIADDIFQGLVTREESFDNNPSKHHISEKTVEFYLNNARSKQQIEERRQEGYTQAVLASTLHAGDEVSFPYGNNWFRAVVGFAGRTPSRNKFYVFQEAVNLEKWKGKKISKGTVIPRQLVISAQEMRQVGILRKPKSDLSYVKDLLLFSSEAHRAAEVKDWLHTAYDSMSTSSLDKFDRRNAEMSRYYGEPETIEPKALSSLLGTGVETEEYVDSVEQDEGVLYSVDDDMVVDPGRFTDFTIGEVPYAKTQEEYAMLKQRFGEEIANYMTREDPVPMSESDFAAAFGGDFEQFARDYELDATRANDDVLRRLMEKQEANKPSFSEEMTAVENTIDSLSQALNERKHNKLVYFLGSGSSLDRKGRILFGEAYENEFNTIAASGRAQVQAEDSRHAIDKVLLQNVFNGSKRRYNNWLIEKNIDKYDAVLADDSVVKISRGEIMSMYMVVEAAKRNENGNIFDKRQEARMRAAYKNFDELLGNLTEEDKAFVEKAAFQMAALGRDESGAMSPFWILTTPFDQYAKNGWDNRKRSHADNSLETVTSTTPIAALDAYDAMQAAIGNKSLRDSGLTDSLQRLKNVLAFADVDRSQYKTFTPEDEALYNRITAKSAKLRTDMQKAIGPRMAQWFLENVEADLNFNPAFSEIANNPALGAFQKLSRNVAAGLLSLNLKQGFNNLGNYHLFLGASDSNMVKFYTVDYLNAWAHFREAWALAMENPEFRRRLEQSGLSEQMRRVADMNSETFITDIQKMLLKKGKVGAADIAGVLNTLSQISVKYGLATNVIPDMVGIALGNYAVYDSVLARNGGDVDATRTELATFILNRVSSSNYETRSLATKTLNKMGLEAVVLFQNDQLQKWGMMAEAVSTLMNTTDSNARARAWKDIEAFAYNTLRYVAVQAGWLAAVIRLMTGDDLTDEEEQYLIEATLRETLSQIGGTSQFSNFITPVLSGIVEGRSTGVMLAPYNAVQQASSAMHKGDWVKSVAQLVSMSGIMPLAPSAVRELDGLSKLVNEDPKEREVGALMVAGRSEPTAQNMLGYSRNKTTGALQKKRTETKEQKERRERKREAAREAARNN